MGDGKVVGRGPGRATASGPRPPSRGRWSSFGAGGALSVTVHLAALALVAMHSPSPLHLIDARTTSGAELTAVAFEVYSADQEVGADLPATETAISPTVAASPAPVSRPRARRRVARAKVPITVESEPRVHGLALAPGADPELAVGAERVGEVEARVPEPLAAAAASGGNETTLAATDGPPSHVEPYVARSLRVYDVFPRIPEPLRSKFGEHAMMLDVCVSERGQVSQVSISPSNVDVLVRALRDAVRTWRYRPLVVQGTPRPFCHVMRVVYRVGRA